jgi:hypothetical protein
MEGFPKTIDIETWQTYLERDLLQEEIIILMGFRGEKILNAKLEQLRSNALTNNLNITHLTELSGNCLFESLVKLGICNSIDSIRQGLAFILYQYQDYKNFFPNQEDTLKELFEMTNEVEYVYCSDDNKLYKYTYDVMCQDLVSDGSWNKLPTQLLLMVISFIYNIKIKIINNESTWINEIDSTYDNDTLKIIYIGHITEFHYLPLLLNNDDTNDSDNTLSYKSSQLKFFKWADFMEQLHNQKIDNISI